MENESAQTPASPPTQPMQPTNREPLSYKPQAPQPQNQGSKTTLFTLIALLILAIIVIFTLYLYMKNTNTSSKRNPQPQNTKNSEGMTTNPTQTPRDVQMKRDLKKYGVVCKRFMSIEQALATPEIACGLDLSGTALTSLPDISKLTNLNSIDLSNNDLTAFPTQLLKLPQIYSINLSNNKITEIPKEVFQNSTLQSINLSGNPIQNKPQTSSNPSSSNSAGLHIEY